MKYQVFWSLIAIWFMPLGAWAGEDSTLKLGLGMKYFAEQSQEMSFNDAVERFKAEDVEVGKSEVLSFGYTASTFWFHEKIPAGALAKASVLILEYALIDYVECYLVQGETITRFTVGDEYVFGERPIAYPEFVFPLEIIENQAADIYLRIRTSSSFQIPLTLMPESKFKTLLADRSVLMGMLQGAFLAQYEVLREHGHSPSEAYNETIEEALESLYPLVSQRGMDWMYANCSTTAQRGALDWAPKFHAAIKPVVEECYQSVIRGDEAKRSIDTNSQPDYRDKLEKELEIVRNQEMWQAGQVLRPLRPENQ